MPLEGVYWPYLSALVDPDANGERTACAVAAELPLTADDRRADKGEGSDILALSLSW